MFRGMFSGWRALASSTKGPQLDPSMGITTRQTRANPLASMIVAHEGEPLIAQSEVALYRARAEELRLEAGQTSWPDVRERVLRLAEQYELLADSVEPPRS
jgi:hypothetical protein